MNEPLVMRCNVCGTTWIPQGRDLGLEQCPHAAVHPALARAREEGRREALKCPDCGEDLQTVCSSEKCVSTGLRALASRGDAGGKDGGK